MAVTDTIDWESCLALANNRKELALELLSMLVADMPIYEHKIRETYAQHDLTALKQQLHKLHGACCYCGVPALRTLVRTAEDEIKLECQLPSFEIIQMLYAQMDRVILESKNYLVETETT